MFIVLPQSCSLFKFLVFKVFYQFFLLDKCTWLFEQTKVVLWPSYIMFDFHSFLQVKQPGLEMATIQSELDLSYRQRYQGVSIPEAYERLILDTYALNSSYFVVKWSISIC